MAARHSRKVKKTGLDQDCPLYWELMSQHDPVPRLRLKYLVLLGLLIVVFTTFILIERSSNSARLRIKDSQVATYTILGEWNRVHNTFARILLTDTFLVPGIQSLNTGLATFNAALDRFETSTIPAMRESPVIRSQMAELALALREGQKILDRVAVSYTDLLDQLEPAQAVLYATMSLQSIQYLYDETDKPPLSYLQIKKLTSELSGLDLYFSEVFEAKKDTMDNAMGQELAQLDHLFFYLQSGMVIALILSSIFFFWQIMGINSALVSLVRSRTADLQETLSKLQDTQNVLLESRRQAGLSSMIMGLAHEINTPLGVAFTAQTALMDNLKLLQADKEAGTLTMKRFDAAMEQQSNLLVLGLRNLKRLNEQITYFRTLSGNRDDLSPHPTNLAEDLRPALEQMRLQAARRSLDFRYSLEATGTINTNARGILQILNHLFQNTLDHAFPEMRTGIITLRLHVEADKLILDFQDNGIGIAPEQQEHVMEPFFTTARAKGHMGLGLNIVHNMVYQQYSGIFEFRHPEQGFGVHLVLQLGSGLPA